MHAPFRLVPAAVLAALLAATACGSRADMTSFAPAPPAGATPYATDDASTDRVSLAFTDLHASLRTLGAGRWEPKYYRVPAGAAWDALRAELEQQATAAGWRAETRLSAQGTGYPRQAWTDGSEVVAAGLVEPPSGSDGATVLIVLTPRR